MALYSSAPMSEPGKSRSGLDVVHLEDDDEWAELVGRWLGQRGLRVHRLGSKAQAKEFLERCVKPPRCFLLDLGLPDSAGLAFCEGLKSSPRLQGVPVVVLSASPVSDLDCLRHGALHRVPKDARAEELLGVVLEAVLRQQEHSRGRVDAGDLTLHDHSFEVSRSGRSLAVLKSGEFAALSLLVRRTPEPVEELELYCTFLNRDSYDSRDPELATRSTVRNYVSRLRRKLPGVGSRIVFVKGRGYAYRPSEPSPPL